MFLSQAVLSQDDRRAIFGSSNTHGIAKCDATTLFHKQGLGEPFRALQFAETEEKTAMAEEIRFRSNVGRRYFLTRSQEHEDFECVNIILLSFKNKADLRAKKRKSLTNNQ